MLKIRVETLNYVVTVCPEHINTRVQRMRWKYVLNCKFIKLTVCPEMEIICVEGTKVRVEI